MCLHTHDENGLDHQRTVPGSTREGRSTWRAIRDGIGAVVGVVLGIAPHLLHHIGLLAGAAVITGASGSALFYLIGLALSIPMLLRLYRHFQTAWAPAIAVAVFTGLFSLSAFVIGPAISSTGDEPQPAAPTNPTQSPTVDEHGH
jgi:hypothetical protein